MINPKNSVYILNQTSNKKTIILIAANGMKIINPITKVLGSSYTRVIPSNTPYFYDILLINRDVAVLREY